MALVKQVGRYFVVLATLAIATRHSYETIKFTTLVSSLADFDQRKKTRQLLCNGFRINDKSRENTLLVHNVFYVIFAPF